MTQRAFLGGFGVRSTGWVLTLMGAAALAGCASSSGGGDSGASPGLFDKALEMVGIKKPAVPEGAADRLPTINRRVTLRLHAGDVLNIDPTGRSLAVVTRVYKLRDVAAFMQAPYDAFQPAGAGSAPPPFAQDVVEAREVVLTPGTKHEVVESLPPEARYIGVVALFRAPAEARWRFVFDSRAAAASGITLGVHGCALSAAQGDPVGANPELIRLAGVRCR